MAGAGKDAPEAVNAGRARPGAAGQAQGTRQVDVPALAAHPHIRVPASVSAAEAADEVSRTMAALVTRLLTEACVDGTRVVSSSSTSSMNSVAERRSARDSHCRRMTIVVPLLSPSGS